MATNDGSSLDLAIVVKGVRQEYDWVLENCPGFAVLSQSQGAAGGKPFDMLTLRSPAGEERRVYFDISSFFGKGKPPGPPCPHCGHTATFVAQFAKILRGYGLDAMGTENDAAGKPDQPAPPFNDHDARAFVDQVIAAATTGASTFPGVGLGETVRIDKDDVIGAALVVDGQPVHVAAFRKGYGR